jgi:hypothetical protein
MKFNDATEAAYKNGYADGVKETEEKLMLEVRDLRIELKAERAIAKVHKAEIERLKGQFVMPITEEDENWYTTPELKTPEEVKAEAYKEFAERLKEIAQPYGHVEFYPNGKTLGVIRTEQYLLKENDIDNLLEEMESESNV